MFSVHKSCKCIFLGTGVNIYLQIMQEYEIKILNEIQVHPIPRIPFMCTRLWFTNLGDIQGIKRLYKNRSCNGANEGKDYVVHQ